MIDAIAQFFAVLLTYIYDIVPNFGAAIIIMTILVKLVTFPLNNKQIQSAKRMQQLQPEMKKIQAKYKDDKEKQNKAVTEFMKENNMNPLAGCLPLLVQFPILIGVFRLLREADLFLDMSMINPYLFQASESINLLDLPFVIDPAGFSISSFLGSISILFIFPLIAGATTYLYSQMSMSADSSQKMMLYMMPVMITVFSFSFPVGLVIYWIMNNLFSIGQHKLIVHLDTKKEVKTEVTEIKDGSAETKGSAQSDDKAKNGEDVKESPKESKSKAKKGKGKK
jgi:YidC/Oxa1 family membrane protein insertase